MRRIRRSVGPLNPPQGELLLIRLAWWIWGTQKAYWGEVDWKSGNFLLNSPFCLGGERTSGSEAIPVSYSKFQNEFHFKGKMARMSIWSYEAYELWFHFWFQPEIFLIWHIIFLQNKALLPDLSTDALCRGLTYFSEAFYTTVVLDLRKNTVGGQILMSEWDKLFLVHFLALITYLPGEVAYQGAFLVKTPITA